MSPLAQSRSGLASPHQTPQRRHREIEVRMGRRQAKQFLSPGRPQTPGGPLWQDEAPPTCTGRDMRICKYVCACTALGMYPARGCYMVIWHTAYACMPMPRCQRAMTRRKHPGPGEERGRVAGRRLVGGIATRTNKNQATLVCHDVLTARGCHANWLPWDDCLAAVAVRWLP